MADKNEIKEMARDICEYFYEGRCYLNKKECDCKCAEFKDARYLYAKSYRKVVLCKDCKHSKPWYADHRLCELWAETYVTVFDDGYCSYGERKEQNNEST